MGSQYVDFEIIERRLQIALEQQFPGRDVAVVYDGETSPRLITATVDGVTATQETWFIDESFSTMVMELSNKLRKLLPAPGAITGGDAVKALPGA
jgi:hypothetical protein